MRRDRLAQTAPQTLLLRGGRHTTRLDRRRLSDGRLGKRILAWVGLYPSRRWRHTGLASALHRSTYRSRRARASRCPRGERAKATSDRGPAYRDKCSYGGYDNLSSIPHWVALLHQTIRVALRPGDFAAPHPRFRLPTSIHPTRVAIRRPLSLWQRAESGRGPICPPLSIRFRTGSEAPTPRPAHRSRAYSGHVGHLFRSRRPSLPFLPQLLPLALCPKGSGPARPRRNRWPGETEMGGRLGPKRAITAVRASNSQPASAACSAGSRRVRAVAAALRRRSSTAPSEPNAPPPGSATLQAAARRWATAATSGSAARSANSANAAGPPIAVARTRRRSHASTSGPARSCPMPPRASASAMPAWMCKSRNSSAPAKSARIDCHQDRRRRSGQRRGRQAAGSARTRPTTGWPPPFTRVASAPPRNGPEGRGAGRVERHLAS